MENISVFTHSTSQLRIIAVFYFCGLYPHAHVTSGSACVCVGGKFMMKKMMMSLRHRGSFLV